MSKTILYVPPLGDPLIIPPLKRELSKISAIDLLDCSSSCSSSSSKYWANSSSSWLKFYCGAYDDAAWGTTPEEPLPRYLILLNELDVEFTLTYLWYLANCAESLIEGVFAGFDGSFQKNSGIDHNWVGVSLNHICVSGLSCPNSMYHHPPDHAPSGDHAASPRSPSMSNRVGILLKQVVRTCVHARIPIWLCRHTKCIWPLGVHQQSHPGCKTKLLLSLLLADWY